MSLTSTDALGLSARRLRVDTLILLRWFAISGQTIASLWVFYYLGFRFPIGPCFVAIMTSATLNIGLRLGTSRAFRLGDAEAAALLGYDILQLGALLYLTGGLANPFAMLLLAPVIISAVSLPRNLTLVLGILMIAVATLLADDTLPLPWYPGEALYFPLLYRIGVWIALALSAAFIGLYAARVSDEARVLSTALVATELVLEREQHLSQLDGLAAAAAHELGTPLATITLITKELQAAAKEAAPQMQEDLALLGQETRRCRDILAKLASLGDDEATVMNVLTLERLIAEVVEPQQDFGVTVTVTKDGAAQQPLCVRNPGILYGLGNLVENAIDFAATSVHIEARWTHNLVVITIQDDGPGFAPAILDRLGDPYVSSRATDRRAKGDEGHGLGLGLFIAKTLLERSGATVLPANAAAPRTGARISISWPRDAFENRAVVDARAPLPQAPKSLN